MAGIFDLLQIQDFEIQNNTFEALREIIELNYEHMSPYLDNFYQIAKTFMAAVKTDDDESKRIA